MPSSVVQLSKISIAFADRDVLKDVNLFLSAESRSALAGVNGSGKTTLMKITAGLAAADSGELTLRKGARVSYLPQEGAAYGNLMENRTLWDEAETAYDPIRVLLAEMEALGALLERAGEAAAAPVLAEYQRLQEGVENSGYYNRDGTISQVLKGLGFSEGDFSRRAGEFSGGWQMRIKLAKVLLESPDLMLLDEPTNYLDIEARTWLETWLKNFPGGYLLVSHDRYFLDTCVNEVYELFQGRIKRYAGNYSAYENLRRQELETLLKRREEQQAEIAKSEDLIRRFRFKASKAAMVQERIRRLEKMERIEIPETLKKISVSFPPAPHSGRTALNLRNLGKTYGPRRVFSGLDLNLDTGEKLVVAGRNGAGKSTLLRIIAGEDRDHEGEVKYGTGIIPAYFSQDFNPQEGSGEEGVLAFMEAGAPAAVVPKLRDMLGAFLFRGDDVYKRLSVLSGGEKNRLALLRLLLQPVNLLVLDEPTNHLDLHSKDILLDALLQFTGTVIFVSHDRAFMEALSTKTLELKSGDGGGVSEHKLYYGGYGYYLEKTAEAGNPAAGPAGGASLGRSSQTDAEARRRAGKQRAALVRRLEREEEACLADMETLEAEKARLEEALTRSEVYADGEKTRTVKAALGRVNAELEEKTALWERIAGELRQNAG
ncbi:MAG: ABC-F family ATP-binding cassette domain-containing protein [Treponema sp.]|nr:ABC-F family ATP-binding cassette domain-containing protein [Treponema sp.]